MAKILISPIGTGQIVGDREYRRANYKFNKDSKIYETSFISSAIAEHLKVDRIIFVGTGKSMWEEVYRYFTGSADGELNEDYWVKIGELSNDSNSKKALVDETILQETMDSVDVYLKKINSKAMGGSSALLIKYGLDEGELWENFDLFMKVAETLEPNDEVYLDITHSFRSIPLFMYLMMDFIETLGHKNIRLKGLYYGMLEVQSEKEYAPIIDLSPLFYISRWIKATNDFVSYGNGYMIGQLTEEKGISRSIENISNLVNINYLTDLQSEINKLDDIFNNGDEKIGAIRYISPLMKDFIKQFKGAKSASKFQLKVSEWYFGNHRYGHGYICLVESILTKLCEIYGLNTSDLEARDRVKRMIIKSKYSKYEDVRNLNKNYYETNKIRNRIAHAAFYAKEKYSYEDDIRAADDYLKVIQSLLNSVDVNKLKETFPLEKL